MAAESHARPLDASENHENRIELDGLETFFSDSHDEFFNKGLSIKQAVFYYGDTRKSLKSKVMNGTVPAIRLPESHGQKWRVFPDGVPEQLAHLIPKKLRPKKDKKTSKEGQSESGTLLETTEKVEFTEDESILLIDDTQSSEPIIETNETELQTSAAMLETEPTQEKNESLENELPQLAEPVCQATEEPIISEPPAAPENSKRSARYSHLLEKINDLEKQVGDLKYRNSYLETRLSTLEEQIKVVTESHEQQRSFNKMAMLIPGIALLFAILIFRVYGFVPHIN
ncbi:MAG: hypothetical protein K2X27_02270 [Candidatus Obscuribacterales bacterium]|nr:hypothetical protein [Candidatus Obscuribacterales bacterium]